MAVTESGHRASNAIDELYRQHGSEVYRYAFAVVGNHADAEDVTQTTFLNAYRALEQGVRPRKPSNWLLAIASNAIKQRFRQEQARPRQVELDDRTAGAEVDDPEGPTVGELLAALSKIPPQQRQAIVLREFEGRSYSEIADILGVTTSALETLLFRARRSLAEELEHQLTCTEAQLAVSRAADGRLGRKERRRLRDHLAECPDCSHFARVQQRHRRALKGLMLLPVPLSLSFLKGLDGTASAATLPASASAVAVGATTGGGLGAGAGAGGGLLAGGLATKAAAVVAAATVAGGVVAVRASERSPEPPKPGARVGQVAPRGVLVPGNGVAVGKASAPGQAKNRDRTPRAAGKLAHQAGSAAQRPARGKSSAARERARGPKKDTKRKTTTGQKASAPVRASQGKPEAKQRATPSSAQKAGSPATSAPKPKEPSAASTPTGSGNGNESGNTASAQSSSASEDSRGGGSKNP